MAEPEMETFSPSAHSSKIPAILVVLALIGGAAAILIYQRQKTPQENLSDQGFNLNRADIPQTSVSGPALAAASAPSASAVPGPSGLSMIRTGGEGLAPMARRGDTAARTLTRSIQANESRYQALAIRYTKKYPVIAQYGADWMSYPDLHRYNDEYFQNHDPIKFAWNVARSQNFAALVLKYAHRPEMTAFVMDTVRTAPADLLNSAGAYLNQDGNAMSLLNKFAANLGLPNGFLAGVAGGRVDPQQATASIIKLNPQLQGLLQQNNIDPNQINSGFQAPKNLPQINNP